jgi:AraC-like DNA-binding protein
MDAKDRYSERPGRHPTVAAVWSYSAIDATSSLIAADGCFDLIVRASKERASAFVYAPVTQAHRTSTNAGESVFGVRLRPGFGAAVVSQPTLLEAAEQLTLDRPDALEALVAAAVDAYARRPSIVADFVEEARATAGAIRLTSASSSAKERELQRACRTWLGLSPKAFLRIERAWAAREAIRRGTLLAGVAADLGYADQAHLTRDVRQLLGVTPRELRPVGILQESGMPNR